MLEVYNTVENTETFFEAWWRHPFIPRRTAQLITARTEKISAGKLKIS
jgi:hypothetical protein